MCSVTYRTLATQVFDYQHIMNCFQLVIRLLKRSVKTQNLGDTPIRKQ